MGRVALALAEGGSTAVAEPLHVIDGLTPASEVVTAPAGVHGLLAEVLIADDIAAARAAETAIAAWPRPATVITKDGTVVGRYVLRGGSGRKQSRIELIAERDRAAARLEEVRAEIERSRFELTEQRQIVEQSKDQSKRALAALREFDAQLAQRTEQLNRARVQAEAAEADSERLRQAAANAEERVAEAERSAADANDSLERVRGDAPTRARHGGARGCARRPRVGPRGRGRGEASTRDGEGAGAGRRVAHPGDAGPVRCRAPGGRRCRTPGRHPSRAARGRTPSGRGAARRRSCRSTRRSPRPVSHSGAPRPSARAETRSCRRCAATRQRSGNASMPSPKTCTASNCASTRRSCTWAARRARRVRARPQRRGARSPSTVPTR